MRSAGCHEDETCHSVDDQEPSPIPFHHGRLSRVLEEVERELEQMIGRYPHPIRCPATMEAIAGTCIYTNGDEEHNLPRHRLLLFSNERNRAVSRFPVSKVVDRIASETLWCPHLFRDEQQ